MGWPLIAANDAEEERILYAEITQMMRDAMADGAENGSRSDGCRNGCGRLPGPCGSMVFPFVAMQPENARRYGQQEALREGTLFPGLNLPFHRELESRFPAVNTALSELMALDFAIKELGLYLDTHRDDGDALSLFRSYVNLAREGREKYVETYGPLMQTDLTGDAYRWLDDPWPWEKGGND
jgi:spore coat protein JB